MGGRGASSGISKDGNKYGSQYKTVFQSGNIKFVEKTGNEPLMETMTDGRVYVQVGGSDLLRVMLFDENNMRNKTLEKNRKTGKWHVHNGYFHNEYGDSNHDTLTKNDWKLLAKITRKWHNRIKT